MNAPELRLILLAVTFDRLRFAAVRPDGTTRAVDVLVGSGSDWFQAVRFPNWGTSDGESFEDDELDRQVRQRAAEELVRLEAATAVAKGRLRAA